MIIKIISIDKLKQIFTETLLNKTNKVSKISPGSVLNGVAYGVGKLQQKALKDGAIFESHLFPDSAFGIYLDNLANLRGVSARFNSTKSSGFVRVFGLPGTSYQAGIHTFTGDGIDFDVVENFIMNNHGWGYVRIQSQDTGVVNNVDALSIDKITPLPAGHDYCINEFRMTGGADFESDEDFRKRIKTEVNALATNTISKLTEVFRKINNRVLRVFNNGVDIDGDLLISLATVDGTDLTNSELNEILLRGQEYFSLNELKPNGSYYYGIKIQNVKYYPIDISVRVEISQSYSADVVRKDIQVALSQSVDYRYWKDGGIIKWLDLADIVNMTDGVERVVTNKFSPSVDIIIPKGYLPRIRGFVLMNLSGDIITNVTGTLNPVYFPIDSDFNYQSTVLRSL